MKRGRFVCLAAMLLAAMLVLSQSALAVVLLTPKGTDDLAERMSAARESLRARKLGSYGMVPIYGRDIRDGEYDVGVQSTSVFFKIARASLAVAGDGMRADITIGSTSYLYVYPGTAAEAEAAPKDDWIEGVSDGQSTVFSIDVPSLNAPFECAAYSKNRQQWYDRQLLIDAAALPKDALAFELPDYALADRVLRAYEPEIGEESQAAKAAVAPEPVAVSRPDGEYAIEVNLAGGSGRASVSSPTLLIVRDGRAYARLLWSSPYYDYMIVGDMVYENETVDGGNSTFEIPITALDEPMPVIADTTAMGDPIEINYALTFYEESIGDRGQIPQEAAKKVLMISLAIIVLGAVLNYFVKKKRK